MESIREVIDEASSRYTGTASAEQVRQIRTALDESASPPPASAPSSRRREETLAAGAALRALDALVRSDPPPAGAAAIRHRLDRIRSGTRELAEVDAIAILRGGDSGLDADEVETAARLLGESGADPRSRLGLARDTGSAQITTAAEQALARWRGRASHPGTAPKVRLLAATVLRSCEHLLHGQ